MSNDGQFEHIENKIKQTLEGQQPAFDEKAWAKMEALLDKEDKKKRPFFWLRFVLPLLLVGGGFVYYFSVHNSPSIGVTTKENIVSNPVKNNLEKDNSKEIKQPDKSVSSETSASDNITKIQLSQSSQNGENVKSDQSNNVSNVKKDKPVSVNNKILQGPNEGNYNRNTDAVKNYLKKGSKNKFTGKGGRRITTSNGSMGDQADDSAKEIQKETITTETLSSNILQDINVVDNAITGLNKKEEEVLKKKDELKDSSNTIEENKKDVTKKSSKKSFPLYFIAAVGPDIGSVKLFSFNKSSVTPKYGIAVGYQVGKRWSIQTGFYAARKKYVASHDDYHVKAGSYWSHADITKVEAACTIYEIPVTARFDFKQKPTTSYYATLGLSSYLMKKEDYNYYYILYNVPGQKFYSYTGNKHFLSNLNISAGIEKKLSDIIALQVEPSVSVPLSGVGDGKVKLFSTALMLGIKFTPFKK